MHFKFTKADKHEPNRLDSVKDRNNKTRTNEFMKPYFLVEGKFVYTKIVVKERPLSHLKGFFINRFRSLVTLVSIYKRPDSSLSASSYVTSSLHEFAILGLQPFIDDVNLFR